MTAEDQPLPTRICIYGSCVSRDTFEHMDPAAFSLTRYVARQSLISGFSTTAAEVDLSSFDSTFQRRMLRGDAAGDLPAHLATDAASVDLLLWDLTDERLGVFAGPDGRVVTRTTEGLAHDLYSSLDGWSHLPLGTPRHQAAWQAALERFIDQLRQLELLDRTLLLEVPWAAVDVAGVPVPSSFGTRPDQANRTFAWYYEHARAAGVRTVTVEPDIAVAAVDHPWGPAPFHYHSTTYRALAESIGAHARSDD